MENVHKGKRRHLVNYLMSKGISDQNVLQAINKIPRHLFLESIFEDYAYEDRAFPIAADQTISHPSTVAEQTQLLRVISASGEKYQDADGNYFWLKGDDFSFGKADKVVAEGSIDGKPKEEH
ncbi:hypothetical protein HAV29_17890 [Elizabethkingia miricola]|nr:hypothetical protein [Elizabethkingia miricola]